MEIQNPFTPRFSAVSFKKKIGGVGDGIELKIASHFPPKGIDDNLDFKRANGSADELGLSPPFGKG